MGVNTWAAFAGSDTQAVVDGDFAVLKDELQPLLKIFWSGGINIVAIHQHMAHDQPHYLLVHYWGKGGAVDLAKTVKNGFYTFTPNLANRLDSLKHHPIRNRPKTQSFLPDIQ